MHLLLLIKYVKFKNIIINCPIVHVIKINNTDYCYLSTFYVPKTNTFYKMNLTLVVQILTV